MKLLLLSKENIPLAKAEAEALLSKGKLDQNVLLINTKKTTNRLAQTKLIGILLFTATKSNLESKIKKFNWNKIIKRTFALDFLENNKSHQTLSRKYGGMIFDNLKNPKVNLENPGTKITIIKNKTNYYITQEEWKNNEGFFHRKPRTWPEQAPITLDPKLARTCVNLTGSSSQVYDPFCGIGGFLIEAGLMNLKAIGSDIDSNLIKSCSINLQHHKIGKYFLFQQDALKINKKYDYIVTDVPYGKNTKNISNTFYVDFLNVLKKILKKRAVLMFPHYAKAENIIKKAKLKIKSKNSAYVHGSLTREIFVVEK
ncbi:methyltransferase domain-containing protein [Candidatus Woesearchaeota archaeon]|nr:methyltransferase domain-containing protein [Candidatus Woesearchaeota archaeon]